MLFLLIIFKTNSMLPQAREVWNVGQIAWRNIYSGLTEHNCYKLLTATEDGKFTSSKKTFLPTVWGLNWICKHFANFSVQVTNIENIKFGT